MLSIAYLGLIVFIVVFEATRKKETLFDFLSLFHLFFILLYPLPGFFLTSLGGNFEAFVPHLTRLTIYDVQHTVEVPIAIFLTYFLVISGYFSPSVVKYASIVTIIPRSTRRFWLITCFILGLGISSILIYANQYGGLVQAIADANFIRSGTVEGQALGFFIRLVYFNFFAAYLIASWLFINRNRSRNLIVWLLFVAAIAGSLVSALLVSARATMIIAIGNFYLAYILYRRKLALPILIPLLVGMVFFIVYGKILFYSLSGLTEGGYIEFVMRFRQAANESNDQSSFVSSIVGVFSYGFTSLYIAVQEHYSIRLLGDWIYGIGSFLPDRLLNTNIPDTVSTDNTKFLIGHNEYEIPAGFIAACWYSWSWVGVVIYSFAYGWIGRYIQIILYRHLYKIFWVPFLYVSLAQAWSDFLASGDPRIFLQANFWVLASLFFILIMAAKISFDPQLAQTKANSIDRH